MNFATTVTWICFRECVSTIIGIYFFLNEETQGFEAQLNLAAGSGSWGWDRGQEHHCLAFPTGQMGKMSAFPTHWGLQTAGTRLPVSVNNLIKTIKGRFGSASSVAP